MNGLKIPHRLRIIILLLRLELGVNFFYLGWSTLFNPALGHDLGRRALGNLYAWIAASANSTAFQTFSAWAFIAIGVALVAGMLTRVAAIAAIALTAASYAPAAYAPAGTIAVWSALTPSGLAGLANDGLLVAICLFIIIFSNAGEYFGLDKFIHIHLFRKHT